MKRTGKLVAIVAALTLTATACSSNDTTDSSPAPTDAGSNATTDTEPDTDGNSTDDDSGSKYNYELINTTPQGSTELDSITWNSFAGEPPTINPYFSANYQPGLVLANMCESLLQQQPDFSLAPNLATAVEYADPTTLIIDVRDDVTFWNGDPMTMDDVVFSLQYAIDHPETFFHETFSDVATMQVTGDWQITLNLTQPNYLLRDQLSSNAGMIINKDHFLANEEEYGSPSVGVLCTGPYEFTSWQPGQNITMNRFDNYWNEDVNPKVKEIKITFLTDDASIVAAMKSGEIDGTYNVPDTAFDQLIQLTNGDVYTGPGNTNNTFFLVNPEGPLRDPLLREALQIAIPWQDILDTVFHGLGEVGRGPVPPSLLAVHGQDVVDAYYALPEPKSGDLDAARALIEQASEAKNETILLITPSTPSAAQMGQAIQAVGQSIGLDIALSVEDSGATFNSYLFDPEFQATQGASMVRITEYPGSPTALDWFDATARSGAMFNSWGYNGVDDLYQKALQEPDEAERNKLIIEIQAQLTEDLLPMIPGLMMYNSMWMNNRMSGAVVSHAYLFYPWAVDIGGIE